MSFPVLTIIGPPKFTDQDFQILNKPLREFEVAHSIRWNRLDYEFDQNFRTCLRQKFFFPPLEFFPYPFFNVDETLFLRSIH